MKRIFALKRGAFIDVGANIGQTLIDYIASGHDGGYIGFEPNPECVVLLNQIIARNNLHHVNIVPSGLADRNGILRIFVTENSDADSGGSLLADLRPEKQLKSFSVPCYRFDDVTEDLGLNGTSLIKIDVEGAELLVLLGMKQALKQHKSWLIVEVLFRDARADEIDYNRRLDQLLTFIEDADYRLYAIEKTADERAITGIVPLDNFPRAVWTEGNKHQCDYLLVPNEEVALLAKLPYGKQVRGDAKIRQIRRA